ncbi:hypothetical protein H310_13366 [Aphanomyces invadans]|uniref:ribose-phosphate diphosphokinase n=1 Tax=Aphanomyces invadans TaxID=157072 RepID=A0A024TG39_9STRA|nr:hypothetical protein H310_13366 [Aphanomyces invadans]ETV92312.1 hypothetical protein H310_13366 [Aphanomyces invadans]|eukprot:XP_008879063.1 hypothetical protein H310_13366 [Aphanomyces invadans]
MSESIVCPTVSAFFAVYRGVARAKKFRKGLVGKENIENVGLAMNIRQSIKTNEIHWMYLIGKARGSDCIIDDDIMNTTGPICKAAQRLSDHGARNEYVCASHGLFNGPANERIHERRIDQLHICSDNPNSIVDDSRISSLGTLTQRTPRPSGPDLCPVTAAAASATTT